MIVFDSSFELTIIGGNTDLVCPVPLNNGKFYLNEACYNENKAEVDALGITFETREVLESEYVIETPPGS